MSDKNLNPRLIKFFVIVAVSVLLIFFNPKGIFSPVRQVFSFITYPFQKTLYILSRKTSETAGFLGSISNLKKENENLIRENNSLAAKIAMAEQENRENETLREQLNLAPKGKFDLEASFIIGQDPENSGSWVTIDKGSFSGVQSGMSVIVSDGILVGRVEEAMGNTARVNLLTSPTSSVSVIDEVSGAKGIVKGEFGLGTVMDMVSQADILKEGDNIITSGLGGEVPRGLLVGKIQSFKVTDDKLFQQALIAPRVKYSKLDMVFVIKSSK